MVHSASSFFTTRSAEELKHLRKRRHPVGGLSLYISPAAPNVRLSNRRFGSSAFRPSHALVSKSLAGPRLCLESAPWPFHRHSSNVPGDGVMQNAVNDGD